MLIVHLVFWYVLHTFRTKRDITDFSALAPPQALNLSLAAPILGVTTAKELFHLQPLGNSPLAAHQTPVAAAVPEAPAKADALITAKYNLAAHLAHGEVEQRIVTGFACEAGPAAYGLGRGGGGMMGTPAESAEIG